MMKKMLFFIGVIVILAACLLSQETKYYFIGCIVFMGLFSLAILRDLYRYTQRRREMQNAHFNLKSANVFWELVSCIYFSVYFTKNFLINGTEVGPREVIMTASIIIYGVLGLYSIIFQKPMINENGILFSNGDFVIMNNIKKVDVEEDKFIHNKKLIFYCNNRFYTLKVKKSDYEDIKNLIQINDDVSFSEN